MGTPSYRLVVDVGGTFTDLLLFREDTGDTWRAKVPSMPEDQSLAVLAGKDQILKNIPDGGNVVLHVVNHGTTVATNAILEQKGAKVALVVTEGYKDILQTRRSQVPGGLASWIVWPKPEPLAPLELTVEAPGRLASNGDVVREFDKDLFLGRLRPIVDQKPDAVTISLINSFANPLHEQAARQAVEEVFPDIPVSISSEVLPELMEYERTITTVVNSYVEPTVRLYLENLLKALEGKTKHLRILRSDGGLSSVRLACRYPVSWVMSGPAGGVTGAVSLVANRTQYKNLMTLDMGGTSTDVALIENGIPHIRRETTIGDLVVKASSIDVRTVGSGGGSIARVPEVTKALRVGPESAGSVPGPACYGKGGTLATVSDANAVLGYLPANLLGGAFPLDLDSAAKAVQQVAHELGVSLYEAAEGILKLSNETMYGALRLVSVEQGYDPRDFSLVAFGGAGPLHANSLGKLIGAWPVIVPPSPGVLCAFGDATTLLRHESARAFTRILGQTNVGEVMSAFTALLAEVKKVMRDDQGVAEDKQRHTFQADLRYGGQANNVPVDVDLDALKANGLAHLHRIFDAEHVRLFTYSLAVDVEIVNLRVIAEEPRTDLPVKELKQAESPDPPSTLAISTTTLVFAGKEHEGCPVWDRSGLLAGHVLHGPCLISEMDSNTLIHPGYKTQIDALGNILIGEAGNMEPAGTPDPSGTLDTVTVDIFENALRNARNEMDALMTRTTMSPAIREQQDEFNVIAEPSGKMLVGQFGSFIGDFLEMWKGSIEAGDVFMTNDPYSVAGAVSHHNDWLILTPIFVDEKLIAWTSNFGHMTDVGGSVPGSLPCAANSVFEEGIQIPVTKIAAKGVWNHDLMEVIYRNVRLPEWNRGDVRALVAACDIAGRRMTELYTRFGDSVYFAAIDELLQRNRKAIASIISSMPEEPASFEDWIDDDGQGVGPWKIACTMTKKGEKLHFDFSKTDPQSPSSINFYLSVAMFKMFVGIYMLVVHDTNVVANDGFHDLLDVTIPEGTLLHPIRPAALSCRTHFLGRLFDVLSGLLGQRAPEFMTAAGFSDSPHFMYSGYRQNGDWFQLYWIGFGGIPARPIGDGPDGHCLWPAMKAIPNEFLELYYPLRIERFDTVPDSGGAGLHRGGNAQRIHWRFLEPGTISIHDDRWLSKPWGVLGGEPGARSRKTLVRDAGAERVALGSKQDGIEVREGDVLEWITWGGGGWGEPRKRDPQVVALEVRRRLVSREGAERGYGVFLKDGCVDLARTEERRRGMEREREGLGEVVNRGGSWEELKDSALKETGLQAPRAPREVRWRGPVTRTPWFEGWRGGDGDEVKAE
ncbi:MAG: hypothetical protein LQ344_006338 [Seirophora lacunosa]|nr:MAG: hypothetical protein LQ344_006338 [Seirophora lacunosa]